MKQARFETMNAELWQDISALIREDSTGSERLPEQYRKLCQCLALARQRGYSPLLTRQLHDLVLAAHRKIYGSRAEQGITLWQWLTVELPCRVRQEWRLLLLATLAFWGVALCTGVLVWYAPHWAYSWMSPTELSQMRSMYDPGNEHVGRSSNADDVQMFGFYIWNNVSICFRTFASGLLGGIPSLLSLLNNGINGGVVASWLSRDPAVASQFWSFVITHSSFEITGLMLSGMAGMRLGWTLLCPGRMRRQHALSVVARHLFPILVGASLLTLLAAFFEGFWSASAQIPHSVKYAVGAVCWTSVIAFFTFAGRGRDAAR